MKASKVISTISLLSLTLLLGFNNNVQASETEHSTAAVHEEQNLVSFGTINNIDLRMESTSLESLEEGERHRLLSYAVEILTGKDIIDSQNEISTYSSTGTKVIHTAHNCYPIGPYLQDKYYRVAYFYNENTGKPLGKIDFYICGHIGKQCSYLASITTYY